MTDDNLRIRIAKIIDQHRRCDWSDGVRTCSCQDPHESHKAGGTFRSYADHVADAVIAELGLTIAPIPAQGEHRFDEGGFWG